MPDREKVIKGLEQFIADFKPFCGNKSDWQRVDEALALLKAQDVMVMAGAELTDAELIEEIRKAPFVLKPNVDAIPVEWLEQKRDCQNDPWDYLANAIDYIIAVYRKEQEANNAVN